ncbi:hypothetical protein Vretimale_7531, partial [Volvox reticuliferus]
SSRSSSSRSNSTNNNLSSTDVSCCSGTPCCRSGTDIIGAQHKTPTSTGFGADSWIWPHAFVPDCTGGAGVGDNTDGGSPDRVAATVAADGGSRPYGITSQVVAARRRQAWWGWRWRRRRQVQHGGGEGRNMRVDGVPMRSRELPPAEPGSGLKGRMTKEHPPSAAASAAVAAAVVEVEVTLMTSSPAASDGEVEATSDEIRSGQDSSSYEYDRIPLLEEVFERFPDVPVQVKI